MGNSTGRKELALNGRWVSPHDLKIVGIDTAEEVDGIEHFLRDDRVRLEVPEGFVKNIARLGVRKPVLATFIDGEWYVIDGRQRVRAARIVSEQRQAAGEPPLRVPVIRQEGEEAELLAVGVSANEFNVPDTPLGRARKAQRLADLGMSVQEVATMFGVHTSTIHAWKSLLGMSPKVIKAVEEGKVGASAVAPLKSKSREEQEAALDKIVPQTGEAPMTAREVKRKLVKEGDIAVKAVLPRKTLSFIAEHGVEYGLSEDFCRGVSFSVGVTKPEDMSGVQAALEAYMKRPAVRRGAKKKTPPEDEKDETRLSLPVVD